MASYTFSFRRPGPPDTNVIESRTIEIPNDEGWPPDVDYYLEYMRQNGYLLAGDAGAPTAPVPSPLPASNVLSAPSVLKAPSAPPPIDISTLNIPRPTPVVVVQSGRRRTVDNIEDLQKVLQAGGTVVRADGSLGIVQIVQVPGWSTPGYLVDGNPLNVVLGQGWQPGQKDFVATLAAQGAIPPSLANAPTVSGSGDSVLGLVASVAGFWFLPKVLRMFSSR